MVKFKEKSYSNQLNYDETDSLKRMKDSDILSQQKKTNGNLNMKVAKNTAIAGVVGAGVGKLAGRPGLGLAAGLVTSGITLAKQKKQREQNEFYNDRLEYAQRQAQRREHKDFRDNMTFREGYTY